MVIYFKPKTAGIAVDDLEAAMDEKGIAYTEYPTVQDEPHLNVDGTTMTYEEAQNWVENFDAPCASGTV